MTPMAEFLRQMPRLRRRAFEHTHDTNAAYMLVHRLMARAMGRGAGGEHDPDVALTQLIASLTRRPPCTSAAI
jgi:hypothetical protein